MDNTQPELFPGISDDEFRTFIGKDADYYYLEKWKSMKDPSMPNWNLRDWNWLACLVGVFWLGYRKVYRYIVYYLLVYLVFDSLVMLIGLKLGLGLVGMSVPMKLIKAVLFSISFAVFADGLYYRHVTQKITEIKLRYPSAEEQKAAMAKEGDVSWWGVGIAIVMCGCNFVVGGLLVAAFGRLGVYHS